MKGFTWLVAVATLSSSSAFAAESNKAQANYQRICQNCHGERGDGKGVEAAFLRTKPKDFAKLSNKSDEHLFKVIKEGGAAVKLSPLMRGFANELSDDEIRELVRYVQSLSQRKT